MTTPTDAQEALRRFSYDPSTGVLTVVAASPRTSRFIGREAGTIYPNGYRYVQLNGSRHPAHRVIWLMVKGRWPKGLIDHIDGNPLNNAISNLRDVDASTNAANKHRARSDSMTGIVGVERRGSRWIAYIYCRGKRHGLGSHATAELAVAARAAAKPTFHPEFRHAD